jgi:hypothetical protein
MKPWGIVLSVSWFVIMPAIGADKELEIQRLLAMVAESPCTFARNGKTYSAENAAAHLAMKYSRGKKYAASTEQFIERLASKSSLSGRPYHIQCPGTAPQTSREWLTQKLEALRGAE